MRAVASAAPSSNSAARVSSAGASSSSARRRKRTAWSAAPRSPARRAASVSASNAQRSPAGGVRQEVDGRALAPRRVARELAGSGEMQLRLLGRGDRVRERLLDDRVEEPRRQRAVQQLGVDQLVDRARRRVAVEARDRRGIGERRIVAEDRERSRDRRDRRRSVPQPRGHEAGHRRRAHGSDRAAAEARRLDTALPQGGDELAGEQRVAGRGLGAGGADLVAHVVAEAGADERRDGRRAERRRPDRGARLALDHPGQGSGAGSPVRTARIAQAGSSSSRASR